MDFAIDDERELRSIAKALLESFLKLGIKYEAAEEYQKAINYFQKSLAIAEALRVKEVVERAYGNLGRVYECIGQYQLAIDCFNKQVRIVEELGDRRGIGEARGNLGVAYRSAGQYQKSIKCHLLHLDIAKDLRDKKEEARAHMNMGSTCQHMGQYTKAYDYYSAFLTISEELGNKQLIGIAYGSMGNACEGNAQYQKAIDYYQIMLEIFQEALNKKQIGEAYSFLGRVHPSIGQYKKAMDCHQEHLKIAEELKDTLGQGNAYGAMGIVYRMMGQYHEAIDYHRKHLEIAERLGNKRETTAAYVNMGNTYNMSGQYEEAMECHRKSLEIAQESENKRHEGMALLGLATVYHKIGEYRKAIDYEEKSLEIAEAVNDKEILRKVCENMGNTYNMSGQHEEAIEYHRKSLEIAQESGNKRNEGIALFGLANVYHKTGEYRKAIDYDEKSLEIAKAVNDKETLRKVCENMGSSYLVLSRYQKAIESFSKQLEVAQEVGDKEGEGQAYVSIGLVYLTIGQYRKAKEFYGKHLEICKELRSEAGIGRNYGYMASFYYHLGQYQKAIDYHQKSLKIAEELGEKDEAAKGLEITGSLYIAAGEYQRAIQHIQKSLDVVNKTGDKLAVVLYCYELGEAYLCTGQQDKAIESCRRSLKIAHEIGNDVGVALAKLGLGLCYQGDDDRSACLHFAGAILDFHNVRSDSIRKDEFNILLSDRAADNYKVLLQSLLNLKQVKSALLVSDSGKAKGLYDLTRRKADVVLDFAQEKNITSSVQAIVDDPSLKASEALLYDVLSEVINRMEDGSIISYTFSRDGRLHAWVISGGGVFYKQWQPVNGMSAKAYLTIVGDFLLAILSAKPFQDRKNVTFYLDEFNDGLDDQITSPVANERESRYLKSTFIQDLKKRVQRLARNDAVREKGERQEHVIEYDCVKKRYNLDQPTSSHHGCGKSNDDDEDEKKLFGRYLLDRPTAILKKSLLHPGENKTQQDTTTETYQRKLYSTLISPIKEYLVGPKLLVVPESSLFRVPFCAFLNSEDQHLCDRFSLQFTPSLHVLDSCLSRLLPKLGPALFVGNPTVGEVKFGDKVGSVPSLPNATVEARECGKYFSAEPLLEENATKKNVLKRLKDASIIHIAAHGHMDHADIFLAPNEGAPTPPSEEHYLLTAIDIVDCTLKARLVVLSCCHSGRGQISAEGVVGIARSFLGAGARSILVTLWQIPDKPTMEFMVLFYDRVCQGLSVCVALQQAMLELKKKYHAMKTWAPFQIVGEDVVLTQDDIEEIRRQSRAT